MVAVEMALEIAGKETAGNCQQFPPHVLQTHAGKWENRGWKLPARQLPAIASNFHPLLCISTEISFHTDTLETQIQKEQRVVEV